MVSIEIYYSDYSYEMQQETLHKKQLIATANEVLDQDLMKYTAHKKPYETVRNVQKIDKLLRSAVVRYNLHPSLELLS